MYYIYTPPETFFSCPAPAPERRANFAEGKLGTPRAGGGGGGRRWQNWGFPPSLFPKRNAAENEVYTRLNHAFFATKSKYAWIYGMFDLWFGKIKPFQGQKVEGECVPRPPA